MNRNQQIVLLSFVLLGLAVAMFLSKGLETVWSYGGWYDFPLLGQNITLTTLLAVALSSGCAVYLAKREDVWEASTEIVIELSKVTWPNIKPWFSMKSEVWAGTAVVIITVFIFALILGVFDFFWAWMTDFVYG